MGSADANWIVGIVLDVTESKRQRSLGPRESIGPPFFPREQLVMTKLSPACVTDKYGKTYRPSPRNRNRIRYAIVYSTPKYIDHYFIGQLVKGCPEKRQAHFEYTAKRILAAHKHFVRNFKAFDVEILEVTQKHTDEKPQKS